VRALQGVFITFVGPQAHGHSLAVRGSVTSPKASTFMSLTRVTGEV
jgi:hypothetical protein